MKKITLFFAGLFAVAGLFAQEATIDEVQMRKLQQAEFFIKNLYVDKLDDEKLVDAAYNWCADRAAENDLEDDKTADYFRKRVPMYIVRYGLVHAVLRDYHYLAKLAEAQKPLKLRLNKSDIDFGLLIGDFIYDMQTIG